MATENNKKVYRIIVTGILLLLMVAGAGCTPSGQAKIDKFCAKYGSDVEATDKIGNTLLHTAVLYDEIEVVKFLVSKGADVNARNEDGRTPLHMLAAGKGKFAEALVSAGADVNAQDNSGKTPLDLAKEKEWTKMVEYLSSVSKE